MRRLLALLLFLPACFQLREPEPAVAPSEYIQPTRVDLLLANFTTAVQHLNPANYERSFSGPDYRFVPDPTAAGSSAAQFAAWSVTEESAYFNSLRNHSLATATNALALTNQVNNPYTVDSVEFTAHYQLRVAQRDTAFHPTLLEGNMRLLLRRRSNEWRIVQWRDQRTSPAPCWTDLKKYFISH